MYSLGSAACLPSSNTATSSNLSYHCCQHSTPASAAACLCSSKHCCCSWDGLCHCLGPHSSMQLLPAAASCADRQIGRAGHEAVPAIAVLVLHARRLLRTACPAVHAPQLLHATIQLRCCCYADGPAQVAACCAAVWAARVSKQVGCQLKCGCSHHRGPVTQRFRCQQRQLQQVLCHVCQPLLVCTDGVAGAARAGAACLCLCMAEQLVQKVQWCGHCQLILQLRQQHGLHADQVGCSVAVVRDLNKVLQAQQHTAGQECASGTHEQCDVLTAAFTRANTAVCV